MTYPMRSLLIAAIVGAVATVITVSYFAMRLPDRGVALEDLPQLYRPEATQLGTIVIKNYREFRGNTVRWSAAYFGCLFGSAFLSAMAALILKLEWLEARPKLRNDLAASMATVAALLVTLSTTGDFQRKWHANRAAATAMENLAYELARPSAATNPDAVLTRIQEINSIRNQDIVGDLAESESEASRTLPSPAQSVTPGDAPRASRH